MRLKVIAVGKVKEEYLRGWIESCLENIRRVHQIEVIEIADEKAPENMSLAGENEVKDREGKRILKHIGRNDYVIGLAILGAEKSSEAFSKEIRSVSMEKECICFLIGGSLGLSEEVLRACHEHLSFSKMTFPHQLMRVILLEQLKLVSYL